LEITHIHPESPLVKKVRPGDILVKIAGIAVEDDLDYLYLQAEEKLKLEFLRGDKPFTINLKKDYFQCLHLSFPTMKPYTCGNDCVFCFVDQHPPRVRKSLLVKDEDYRFSFLYGNFITLSNLSHKSIARIREYHLSPLYISVHAMDMTVRNKMLGRKQDDGFLSKFQALVESRIKLHTQVVIVPAWNDGEVLKDTIEKLSVHYPAVASIALIPVGLTQHRRGLTPLRLSTAEEAISILNMAKTYRNSFKLKLGSYLVYCADEMFLLAGQEIPTRKYYEKFPQVENGVGMVRKFLDDFSHRKRFFPPKVSPERKMILVTGTSMSPILKEKVLPVLQQIAGLKVELITVENHFLGETITVAGLLAGTDILSALKGKSADLILLPPNCLNQDGLFIDDISIEDFRNQKACNVLVYDYNFKEVFRTLDFGL
jgi:putative radical SAM enzyme (TIGR03279 family)